MKIVAAGVVAVLAVGVAGCANGSPAAPDPAVAAAPGFPAQAALAVLAAFDQADSVASAAADPAGLKAQEVPPSLDVSLAAAHRATLAKRTPPSFVHTQPGFAVPAGDASCFLVVASLKVTGTELPLSDVTQFVRQEGGGWKASHNVGVGQSGVAQARTLAGSTALPSTTALDDVRRKDLETEVFARTTAADSPNLSVLATSNLLDRQFAAGWEVYQQQLGGAGMTAARELREAQWSQCAARTDAGVFAFLTLRAADTVSGSKGKPAVLAPPSPDLAGLGRTGPVSASRIVISRVQVFLLFVPAAAGQPATLLGLTDAPTALSTS
ncbi:hypothetical protein GCM10010435_59800 [Winogradskya consettensis]|uniref:Lipoprotein n=1 Tax=Winogradskya consettensis TaxID=113560 RepID=A0A919ST76_9ACTN|nr:hypothetical protein [Actinoplanes consettensis]GIM76503.1 hypothetical protein Aco04nite_50760 [Actinoplanes consettensis]